MKANRRIRKLSVFVSAAIIFLLPAVLSGTPLIEKAFPGRHGVLISPQPVVTSSLPGFFRSKKTLSRGKFLVASRNLKDPIFSETVVLLIKYDLSGAMGLVINQPTDVRLTAVWPGIEGLQEKKDTVFIGGPVGRSRVTLLIQSDSQLEDSYRIFDDIYFSQSPEVLRQIIDKGDAEEKFRVYAGYAGWIPGQLEMEISKGIWYIMNADAKTVFNSEPSGVWQELIRRTSVLRVDYVPFR